MKVGVLIVGIFGFVIAVFTALYLRTGFTGPSLLAHTTSAASVYYLSTIGVAALGLVASVLVFWTPKVAAWMAGLVTVAGAFTSGTLWLGAGSFFFVVAALAYSIGREAADEPAGRP